MLQNTNMSKSQTKWSKPELEVLGDAKELILGLGGGKEPGPTDNQITDVNIQFS